MKLKQIIKIMISFILKYASALAMILFCISVATHELCHDKDILLILNAILILFLSVSREILYSMRLN